MDSTVVSNADVVPNVDDGNKKQYHTHDWKPSNYPDLILTEQEWLYIFDAENQTFRTNTYINFFAKKLNDAGITCVLVAGTKYGRYSVVLTCKHDKCTRCYKIVSPLRNLQFEILFDGDILHVENDYTTRPLNGDKRIEAKAELRGMGYRQLDETMRKKADRHLTADGNLDTAKSITTFAQLKSEVLCENDLDKDHIKDLSKMREQQLEEVRHHVPGAEVYIQNVSSNDFYVHAFSSMQIRILKQMINRGEPITLHVDATGSIIRSPEGVSKRIYYYVASIALPILDEKPKMLFPLIEMISSAHDAFTIEIWLRKFINEFTRQVGSWTGVAHFVTDFSFAILNAGCSAFNNEDLIDSVNRIFDELNNEGFVGNNKLVMILHICCNHFMRITAHDIDLHFPPSQSSTVVRTFLKETVALMFNLNDLDALANVYKHLSTILNYKYVTDTVKEAVNFITSLVNENKLVQENETNAEVDEENIELLEFDEPTDSAMYKQSKFYKMFDKLTSKPNYEDKNKTLNNFYCPSYCNLLLSKYISILPLWTSLKSTNRMSNSNAESLFNIIKSRIKENVAIIGHTPIRSSRFLRFTRQLINNIADDFLDQLPRYRCCNKKRQRSTSKSPQVVNKRRKMDSPYIMKSSSVENFMNDPFSKHTTTPKSFFTTPKSSRTTQKSSRRTPKSFETTPKSSRTTPKSFETTPKSSRTTPKSSRTTPNSSQTTPKSSYYSPRPLRVMQLSQNTENPITTKASTAIISTRKSSRLHKNECTSPSDNIEFSTPKSSTSLDGPEGITHLSPSQSSEKNTSTYCIDDDYQSPTSYIGDPNATESWGPKKRKGKPKHTYFQSNLLKKMDSPKLLNQLFEVNDKRVTTAAKLKNHLVDDPSVYYKPNQRFIVASASKTSILSNFDFKSLQVNQPITPDCVNFVLQLFSKKRKDIQFVFFETPQLLSTTNAKVTRIEHQNVIGIIHLLGEYSLFIFNVSKKVISYVDLKMEYQSDQMLVNFLKFLTEHNKTYKTTYDLQGWSTAKMQLPTLQYGNIDNSGVYILHFIQDLITKNAISKKEFDVDEFRASLSHYILNNSLSMKKLCVICGATDDKDINQPIVPWIECEICQRWCHRKCLKSTTFNIAFKCILCE